jgi:hypothetical protein
MMRKVVKIIGLGIAIWGLGLLWPAINQGLTDSVLISLGLVLCLVMLIHSLIRFFSYPDNHRRSGPQCSAKPVLKLLP